MLKISNPNLNSNHKNNKNIIKLTFMIYYLIIQIKNNKEKENII